MRQTKRQSKFSCPARETTGTCVQTGKGCTEDPTCPTRMRYLSRASISSPSILPKYISSDYRGSPAGQEA